MTDEVGGADLYGGTGYDYNSFTDRFGTYSAIHNYRHFQVPPGYYFNGDFSISVWVSPHEFPSKSKILDFGNGCGNDRIVFGILANGILFDVLTASLKYSLLSNSSIIAYKWYHFAITLKGTTGYIYMNGIEVTNGYLLPPENIWRINNYIGKSNCIDSNDAHAMLDDLKIFSGALTPVEVWNEYKQPYYYGKNCSLETGKNFICFFLKQFKLIFIMF